MPHEKSLYRKNHNSIWKNYLFGLQVLIPEETRRERPKSAPYLRLKNIQGTTIRNFWKKNKFFEKIILEFFFRKNIF